MSSWVEHEKYCKEVAEYLLKEHKPTKLEILEIASKRQPWILCGGADVEIWKPILPYQLTEKQLAKLRSFSGNGRLSLFSADEIFRWALALTFPEFNRDEDFFFQFGKDSLFWLLNLEYYKRKQKTIFQDYQLPCFDWDAFQFWIDEYLKMPKNERKGSGIEKEYTNQSQLLNDYCRQVMQIAVDAVAYL